MYSIRFQVENRIHWMHADNLEAVSFAAIALRAAGYEVQIWSGMTQIS